MPWIGPADLRTKDMASARAVEWRLLDPAAERPVEVGDLVSVEAGGMPILRVVGLAGRKAWLDDERGAVRRLASLDSFRWRAPANG
jgi:hypothetical protein